MYVVRRSFRNYNQMMVPGSVVEPGSIKRFKTRLRDRDIVEVSEQDFDKWNAYFLGKFGIPIGPIEEEAPVDPTPGEQLNNDMEPVKVAPVVKAVPLSVGEAQCASLAKDRAMPCPYNAVIRWGGSTPPLQYAPSKASPTDHLCHSKRSKAPGFVMYEPRGFYVLQTLCLYDQAGHQG